MGMDAMANQGFFQPPAEAVCPHLGEESHARAECRRRAGAVRAAAAHGFRGPFDRSFTILKKIDPRLKRGEPHIAIDIPHNTKISSLKNLFLQHAKIPFARHPAREWSGVPRAPLPTMPPPARQASKLVPKACPAEWRRQRRRERNRPRRLYQPAERGRQAGGGRRPWRRRSARVLPA